MNILVKIRLFVANMLIFTSLTVHLLALVASKYDFQQMYGAQRFTCRLLLARLNLIWDLLRFFWKDRYYPLVIEWYDFLLYAHCVGFIRFITFIFLQIFTVIFYLVHKTVIHVARLLGLMGVHQHTLVNAFNINHTCAFNTKVNTFQFEPGL